MPVPKQPANLAARLHLRNARLNGNQLAIGDLFERSHPCLGDGDVLYLRAGADADGADNLAVELQGNAAGEDHDLADIGNVNSVELATGLRIRSQFFGCAIEGSGCVSLVQGDVHRAEASAIHTNM